MINSKLQCPSCGRNFSGDDTLKWGDDCPSDDCPSHWEEKGIPHPDYPEDFKKVADRIDGYDRDDLGESQDF